MMLPIKTITSVLKVSTYSITAHAITVTVILVIMSLSTFITAIILYVLNLLIQIFLLKYGIILV